MKLALFAGFGGVLVLMSVAGLDYVRELNAIQTDDARITRTYLDRHLVLEQIRSSLYLSSTFLRDYLVDSNPEAERASMTGLRDAQDKMNSALQEYSRSLRPEEEQAFSDLKSEIDGYWNTLEPVFQWGPQEKRERGSAYLRGQVSPRRSHMIAVADQIDAFNEQALKNGTSRALALFTDVRQRVTGVLGLALCAGSILAAASIVHILRVEKEGRIRYGQLQRAQEELKGLSARLVDAQETERRAISRELHDQVGQSLNALRVDLVNLAAITPRENLDAHRFLSTARGLADESIIALRNMALLLRPSMLDDLGLVAALGWQAREVSRRTGLRVEVEADGVPDELPDEHKTCVYRVVQEALQNVSRHADAREARITVWQESDHLSLTVQDDGKGFDTATIRGLGLLGMEERVKHLSGRFDIRSEPGRGTLLTVNLPLAARDLHASMVKA